jgi:AI-2 transport protein TqsA
VNRGSLVPAGLPRVVLILMGTAAATITVAGMRSIADLLGLTFLALVITVSAHPLRAPLLRWHLPGWLATLVMVVVAYAVLLVFAVTMTVAVARFATLLPTYQEEMASTVDDAVGWFADLGVGSEQVTSVAESFDPARLADLLSGLLGGVLALVSDLFLVVTLLLFFAVDAAWLPARMEEAPAERRSIVAALTSFASGTRRYLLVCTVFGLIVAVIDTAALWLLGIPVPLLWGLLAFVTNYIPNIGFVLGLAPVAVLALLEGGWGLMLGVIAVYSVINVVIQSIIQPKVIGDAVGLSTSLTFLSLVFWAWVLGPIGAFLAIPLSLLVKAVLVDVDPGSRWLGPLISGDSPVVTAEPATSPGDSPG